MTAAPCRADVRGGPAGPSWPRRPGRLRADGHRRLPDRARLVSRDAASLTERRDGSDVPRRRSPPATRRPARIDVRIAPDADGVIAVSAAVAGHGSATSQQTGIAFAAHAGRALPRLRRALQRGRPTRPRRRELRLRRALPAGGAAGRRGVRARSPGFRPRDDATYFPIPWLLSTAGYGVLLDRDETSIFRLGTDSPSAGAWRSQSPALGAARLRRARGPPTSCAASRARLGRQPARRGAVLLRARGGSRRGERHRRPRGAAQAPTRRARSSRPTPTTCRAPPSRARRPSSDAHRALPRGRPGGHDVLQPDDLHVAPAATREAVAAGRADPQRLGQPLRVPLHGLDAASSWASSTSARPAPTRSSASLLREAFARRLRRLDGGLRRVHPDRRGRADGTPGPAMHNRYVDALPPQRAPLRALGPAAAGPLQPLRLDGLRRGSPRSSGAGTRRPTGASTA